MTRIWKALSFSNVVACLALFIALGGSVYAAGKISGTQVKTNSLPGNRVKAKTLTAKQIKPGSLTGAQIQAGSLTGAQIQPGSLTGTQINASTLSGVTASKLASIQYATATVSLGLVPATGTAACPAGTNVIGGGAIVANEVIAFVNDSGPNATRNGWTATGLDELGAGTKMTITAICTAAAAITG